MQVGATSFIQASVNCAIRYAGVAGVNGVHLLQHAALQPSIDPITDQVKQVQGNFDEDSWLFLIIHFVWLKWKENNLVVSWMTEAVVSTL